MKNLGKKLNYLQRIEGTVILHNTSTLGPRAILSVTMAGLTCLVLEAAIYMLKQYDIDYYALPGKTIDQIMKLTPVIAAVVVLAFVWMKSTMPKSWAKRIDHLLTRYEPLDKDAYRRLQQKTQESGYLKPDSVREWILLERSVINEIVNQQENETPEFLNKKV